MIIVSCTSLKAKNQSFNWISSRAGKWRDGTGPSLKVGLHLSFPGAKPRREGKIERHHGVVRSWEFSHGTHLGVPLAKKGTLEAFLGPGKNRFMVFS